MKLYTATQYILATLVAVSMLGLVGCASTSPQGPERVSASMETVDENISEVIEQLDAVTTSLEALFQANQSNVREAFNTYTSDVSSLQRSGNRLIRNAEELNDRGTEYFSRWQEQERDFTNPEIRRVSEQRRSELRSIYGEIERSNQGLDEALMTFMNSSQELQEYLSNDLTPRGLEAISSIVPVLMDEGDNIRTNLAQMQSSIQRADAEMAQGGMPQQ